MNPKRRYPLNTLIQQLYCRFRDDDVPALGAQLTYYLILSFFPFLIFLITIVGFVQLSEQEIIASVNQYLPRELSGIVTSIVNEINLNSNGALLSFGMLATLWTSSNGFNAIIKGLNKAYDVEENRPFWKVRGISLLATLVLAFIILISLLMLIFGKVLGKELFRVLHYPSGFEPIWNAAQYIIPLIILINVFMLLYKIAPNCILSFKEVIPGAVFSTLGWIITSSLFSFYVNQFGSFTKTYGSIGGIIVLLIWLYLSSNIILLGGEINAALSFVREGKVKKECKSYTLDIPFFKKKKKPPQS